MFPSFDSLGGEIVEISEKALEIVFNDNPCVMSSYWDLRNTIGKAMEGPETQKCASSCT